MEIQYNFWMRFYGKESGQYQLMKGDFLSETYKEQINSATYVILPNLLIIFDKTGFSILIVDILPTNL